MIQRDLNTKDKLNEYGQMVRCDKFSTVLLERLQTKGEDHPNILIDYHKKASKFDRYIGRTYVIMGPRGCGKSSYIYYTMRQRNLTQIISINCLYQSTPQQIMTKMIEKLSGFTKLKTIQKRLVYSDQIQLQNLDEYIKGTKHSFLFMIKNAEKLVHQKKQIILYNLFEWIKKWESQGKIGLALCTCDLDFMNKMEKRVRSRINQVIINLMPISEDIKAPKQMICHRLLYNPTNKKITKETNQAIQKIVQNIQKNSKLDDLLLESARKPCRRQQFYLQMFKIIVSLEFGDRSAKEVLSISSSQLKQKLVQSYKIALQTMPLLIDRKMQLLKNMNYNEYIVMAIIRKIIIEKRYIITFKYIIIEYREMIDRLRLRDSAFNFPEIIMEKAVKNLCKYRIIVMEKQGDLDFQNAQIWSEMTPDAIKDSLKAIKQIPELIKQILEM